MINNLVSKYKALKKDIYIKNLGPDSQNIICNAGFIFVGKVLTPLKQY